MKIGPIIRAQAKRFKDKLAAFIWKVIHSQKGLSIPEDKRPVLSIQVVEVDTSDILYLTPMPRTSDLRLLTSDIT